MKTVDEHRESLLAELVDYSAKIDGMVMQGRAEAEPLNQQALEVLRARQRETTQKLRELEAPTSNTWENIGDGG